MSLRVGAQALVVLATLVSALPAVAQRPMRSGLWAEFGAGGGNVHIGCASCEEPTVTYGRAGYLRVGGAVTPRLVWGIEFFSLLDRRFMATEDETPLTLDNVSISPVVLWYPWRGGVFFKGGIGMAHTELIAPARDGFPEIVTTGTGSGMTFGVGLDVPLFRFLAATANFGVFYSAIGDVGIGASAVDDVITTMYQANFAITIR